MGGCTRRSWSSATRCAALLFALSAISAPLHAAPIGFVQSTAANVDTAATSIAKAFPSANAAGNLIVAVVFFDSTNGTNWTCSDSQQNAYSVATFANDTGHHRALGVCYAAGVKAGANTVTANFGVAQTLRRLMILEYRNVNVATPFDATATNLGTATTAANAVTTPAVSPAQNGELIFGVVADESSPASTITAGTGLTSRRAFGSSDGLAEDRIQTLASTVAATFTFAAAHDYIAEVVTFIPAPDTTFPTAAVTAPAANALLTGTVTVTATAADDTVVGGVQFLLDGVALGAEDLASPYSISWDTRTAANGSHNLSAVARDLAGNKTTSLSVPIKVDNAPPTGTVLVNGGAALTRTTAVTLTLAAADVDSLVTQMRFSNTGSSYSTAEAYAPSKAWTLASSDGAKTVYAQFKDAAGNWSAAATAAITLDSTAPTISAVASSGITGSAAVISWTTNEPSTSMVEFGTTTAYGSMTPVDATLVTAHNVALGGLGGRTKYNYRVHSADRATNERLGSNATFTTTGADSTPPTVPTGVAAASASTSQINVSWAASTDNVGVTGYIVLRGGVQIATPTTTSYADKSLQPGTTYSYSVAARDAATNVSGPSAIASATTQFLADTTPPIVSITAPADGATVSQLNLAVTADASDPAGLAQTASGVAGVQFLLDGAALGVENTSTPYVTSWNTFLSAFGFHTLTARARDAAGNVHVSNPVTVTVSNPSDFDPPSVPSGVMTAAVSASQISVRWTASVDNTGVSGYRVLRDGVDIGGTTTTGFVDSGLAAATTYAYSVRALDFSSNISAASDPSAAMTLPGPDTTPPVVPQNLNAAAPSWSKVTLTWDPSLDLPAPAQLASGTTGYRVFRNGTLVTTTASVSFVDTSLTGQTLYTYTVAAFDLVGNVSAQSPPAAVTTPQAPPDTVPPGQVVDLSVASCEPTACTLTWTAPGNDGANGTADSYDIRYGPSPIIDQATWDAASPLGGAPVPTAAGTTQTVSAANLTTGTAVYFALQASDSTGNVSPTSNTVSAKPLAPFTFSVYGDNRAGIGCSDNTDHMTIVNRIVGEAPDFVIHVGDMIAGFSNQTNWIQRGGCPAAASTGSFKEMITPLLARPVPPGLTTNFFPVIGNHDDDWGDGWYPDSYKNGICDVYGAATVRSLVPNHFQQSYFRDKSGSNYPIYSDTDFYTRLCSTSPATNDVYGAFFYYSFNYNNTHFVVMHINWDYFDLRDGNAPCTPAVENDYNICYNIHQLHWLQYDLAQAKADPNIKHILGFLHAPVFTTVADHTASTSWTYVSQEFSKVNAGMIFAGHNHAYERTVPIYATPTAPNGVRDDQHGTVYVTTGGGGSPTASFLASAWYDVTRSSDKHYVTVTVNNDKISVRVTDMFGNVMDTFAVR